MKSIQCLFWAKFLETIDRIAVLGARCGICDELGKNLGCELQTSNEDYPKLKKIEKMMSKLKSLADELVRIKRGLSPGRSNSGGICRWKETNSAKESFISYTTTSRSNKGFLRQ